MIVKIARSSGVVTIHDGVASCELDRGQVNIKFDGGVVSSEVLDGVVYVMNDHGQTVDRFNSTK